MQKSLISKKYSEVISAIIVPLLAYFIIDTFYLVKCLNEACGHVSRTFDFFLDIALTIPEKTQPRDIEQITYYPKHQSKKKAGKRKNKKHGKPVKPLKITLSDDEEEKVENHQTENNENLDENKENLENKESNENLNNIINNETENPEKKEVLVDSIEKKEEKKEEGKAESNVETKKEDPEKFLLSKNNIRYKYIETVSLENVNVPALDKDYYTLFEPELNSDKCQDDNKNPGGNITLEKCIDGFFEYEKMNIKNNYFSCENCSKEKDKQQNS